MRRRLRRASPLLLLVVCGAWLEIGLVLLWTLSYQLSQQRAFTDLLLARYPLLDQRILRPLLVAGASVLPQLAGPPPPPELGAWFAPLTIAWIISCTVCGAAYLASLALLEHRRRDQRGTMAVVLGFSALFSVTAFSAPGLLSQDIFGYLMYGQIAAVHGLNPYIWPPSAFVRDPLLQWVAPIWRSLPSPYGPVWTDVNWALAQQIHTWSIVDQVLAYKVLGVCLYGLTLALLWLLLGRFLRADASRTVAFTAFAWNPLVLMEVVGNGHNDALVLTLLLLGLVPLAGRSHLGARRTCIAVVIFIVSGLVKYLSAIAGLFIVVVSAAAVPTGRGRTVHFATLAVLSMVLTVVIFAPWLELPDSLDGTVRETTGNIYANAVPDLLTLTVADHVLAAGGMTVSVARETARLGTKVLVDAIFGVYVLWEVAQLYRAATAGTDAAMTALIRASTRAILLIILLVSIWVQSWYFILPLGLSLLLGMRSQLTRIAIGYTLTSLTFLYAHYYLQDAVAGAIFLPYIALPLVVPFVSWLRHAHPLSLASALWPPRHAPQSLGLTAPDSE